MDRAIRLAKPVSTYVNVQHGWEFKEPKDVPPISKWLAKRFWEWMVRIGAIRPHFESHIDTITIQPIHAKEITQIVIKTLRGSGLDMSNLNDYIVVMGTEDFLENVSMENSPVAFQPFSIPSDPIYQEDPYMGRRVYSMPIHVVPWQQGITIIPRVYLETKK